MSLVFSATSDFYENASIQAKSMKLGRDIPWTWGNYFEAKLAFSETVNDDMIFEPSGHARQPSSKKSQHRLKKSLINKEIACRLFFGVNIHIFLRRI